MVKHIPFAALALAFLLGSVAQAGAAPSAAKSAGASAAVQAKTQLSHFAALIQASKTITYTSTVTANGLAGPGQTGKAFTILGTIQKPNLIRMQISDSTGKVVGLLVSNGADAYTYDPVGNKYTKSHVSGSGMEALMAPFSSGLQLIGAPSMAGMLTASMLISPNNFDLASQPVPGGVHFSATHAVMEGKPVSHIVEKASAQGASMTLHLYVDTGTGMLRRVVEDIAENGQTIQPLQIDFTRIQTGTAPLVASNFTWTPPAGATVFTPPATAADDDKPALAAGAVAPDFAAQTTDGKSIHLADYKGKVVVLDFWSTWCGPCQDSLPHTDKIAQTYAAKGVVFLPICTWDDKSAFTKWVGQHKAMSIQFYFDPAAKDDNGSIANKLYGVQGIPTQYVIGKDGKVVTGFVGYDPQGDPDEKALQQALDKALAAS